MSVYDRDDYYSGPPPPPLHGHPQSPPMRSAYDNTGYTSPHSTAYPPTPFDHQDDSRRNRESIDAALYHNEAAMGWRTNRGSMSDVKLTGHYDSDDEHDLLPVPEERKRRSCMDKLCCGCCTCLPRWMRYLCCVLFLIIIALAIVVGVLAALFKTPNVTFNGIEGEPQVNLVGTNITMNFTLSISVDNPNIEGITFEKIVAEAYYPNYDNVSIGGGELDDVHIAKQATTNISFPFSIQIDASSESTKAIASDMMNKCGLTGGSSSQITIDYKVKPTLRIIGIPITPTISESANIDCPTQELSGLTGLASTWESLIPSGVLPTGAT